MRAAPWLRSIFEPIMRIGEVPGEPETKRGGRRVFLVAFVIGWSRSHAVAVRGIDLGQEAAAKGRTCHGRCAKSAASASTMMAASAVMPSRVPSAPLRGYALDRMPRRSRRKPM